MGWRDTLSEYMQKAKGEAEKAKEEAVFLVKEDLGRTPEVSETAQDMHQYPHSFVKKYVAGEVDDLEAGIEELEDRRNAYLTALEKHKSDVDDREAYMDEEALVVTAYSRAAEQVETYIAALEDAQTGDAEADEETVDTLDVLQPEMPKRYETREEQEEREQTEEVKKAVQDFTYTLEMLEDSIGSFSGIDDTVEDLDRYAETLFDTYQTVERYLDLVEEAAERLNDPDTEYDLPWSADEIDIDQARQDLRELKHQLADGIAEKEAELQSRETELCEAAEDEDAAETAIARLDTYRQRLEQDDE